MSCVNLRPMWWLSSCALHGGNQIRNTPFFNDATVSGQKLQSASLVSSRQPFGLFFFICATVVSWILAAQTKVPLNRKIWLLCLKDFNTLFLTSDYHFFLLLSISWNVRKFMFGDSVTTLTIMALVQAEVDVCFWVKSPPYCLHDAKFSCSTLSACTLQKICCFWLNFLGSIFGKLTKKIYIYFLSVEIPTLIWQTQNLYNLWFLSPVFCSCTNICICMVSLCFLFLLLFLKLRYILKVHTETLAPLFSCQNLGAFNLFKVK